MIRSPIQKRRGHVSTTAVNLKSVMLILALALAGCGDDPSPGQSRDVINTGSLFQDTVEAWPEVSGLWRPHEIEAQAEWACSVKREVGFRITFGETMLNSWSDADLRIQEGFAGGATTWYSFHEWLVERHCSPTDSERFDFR